MRRRSACLHARAKRWSLAGFAMALVLPGLDARADESAETADDEAVLLRQASDPTPTQLGSRRMSMGGELTWARWLLASDPSAPGSMPPTLTRASLLGVADLRADHWQGRPLALTTTASALGSSLIAAIPVARVTRGGKVRQRHYVRAFFRSKGIALVWRIEF